MGQIDEKYIIELKEYKKSADLRLKYSIERFDILIISLSSGGLVLGLNLYTNFKCAEKDFINNAWCFFSVALILNLVSQISGYFANKFDIKCINDLIDEIEREQVNLGNGINEIIEKICNYITYFLNFASFICLTIGIVFLITFVNNKI